MKVFLIILLIILIGAAGFIAYNYINKPAEPAAGSSPPARISVSSLPGSPKPSPAQTPSTPPPASSQKSLNMPQSWDDKGIFSAYYEKAFDKLSQMSLEEKIGQMLLARSPEENAVQSIKDYHLGGFVLFERDFKDKTAGQVISQLKSYQDASEIPMILSVDEEGGAIVRISSNPKLAPQPFLSPQQVYAKGGLDAIKTDTVKKAQLLKKLGMNLNLAPVADVSQDPADYIYARSLGKPPGETGKYVTAVVKTMQSQGLSSALKHFPGYGNNKDTHTGIAIDNRSLSVFEQNDFIPFEAGIKAGAESVLVSHNIVNSMQKNIPASLSPNVHRILRDRLKFTGVVMTDDLSMEAVKEYTNNTDPSVQAVLAGNDMLLTTDFSQTYYAVLEAVRSGKISMDQIDHAALRILAWKYSKGLLQ